MRALLFTCALLALGACSADQGNLALGTLERDRIILRATAAEIITAQPVAEGTQVTAGTLLVKLDDRQQIATVAQARAEVSRAKAVLEELRNGARPEEIASASAKVSGARAALVQASAQHTRSVSLVKQKLAAQAELDRSLANRDEAEANLQAAQEELLRLTNGTRQEQLDAGAASLESAAARLAMEEARLSDLSVVATRDAWLDSLPWNVGERVTSGATVAVLLANARPFARVYVPEPWRARVKVGDVFPVHIDGIDEAIDGRLRWISTEPAFTPYYALNASDRSRLMYLAEFDLTAGKDLPNGVPAQVQLGDE